jgi:hypothetical protein
MRKTNKLQLYRFAMLALHIFFMSWIIEIWGIKLKTFLFLTKINFFINMFYFAYTCYLHLYWRKIMKKDSALAQRSEKFVNSILKFSFCLSIAVVSLYWGLLIFAPTMLGDTPTPIFLDLFLHGGNLIVLLIDCILNGKLKNLRETHIDPKFLIQFTITYYIIQYAVYYTMNIQVYPMISKLSIPMYSLVGLAGYGLFMIGNVLFENLIVVRVGQDQAVVRA